MIALNPYSGTCKKQGTRFAAKSWDTVQVSQLVQKDITELTTQCPMG